MYSMTGFGKGEYREGGLSLTVEVKSVNNRFLDLAVKCPRLLAPLEETVRARVRSYMSRGHADVFVTLLDGREKRKKLFVDVPLARAYEEAAKTLKGVLDAADDTGISFYLRLPDVVRAEEESELDGELKEAFSCALETALKAHKAMRFAEGERLKADLRFRMEKIALLREKIAERAPLVAKDYEARLNERMKEFLNGAVDETRILAEVAVYADKSNIDEELTRLQSHIKAFYACTEEEQVGRKLDFLVQEFNRECNTICSKSNDSALTALALEMKNEIEKVREQVQNLE